MYLAAVTVVVCLFLLNITVIHTSFIAKKFGVGERKKRENILFSTNTYGLYHWKALQSSRCCHQAKK